MSYRFSSDGHRVGRAWARLVCANMLTEAFLVMAAHMAAAAPAGLQSPTRPGSDRPGGDPTFQASGTNRAEESRPLATGARWRTDRGTPLGARQDHVRRLMRELDEKFMELARELEQAEPEQSERLVAALTASKESLLENRMASAARLLNDRAFDRAGGEQQRIVADLQQLLETLLAEHSDRHAAEEQARLAAWTRQLAQLLSDELAERRAAHLAGHAAEAQSRLAEHRAALEKLLREQQQLRAATASEKLDQRSAERLGTEQAALAMRAAQLGGEVAADLAVSPEVAQQVSNAAEHAQSASEALREHQSAAALRSERRAESHLAAALAALDQDEQRAAGQPAELAHLALAQDDAAERAQALAEQWSDGGEGSGKNQAADSAERGESAESAERAGGQPPPAGQQSGKRGQRAPGQNKAARDAVAAARQAMQQAAGELRAHQADPAQARETEAIDHLAAAQEQLLERLAELQRAERNQTLGELQARLRELLSRQQAVTAGTAEIERRRAAGSLRRADRLAVSKLASEEAALGTAAGEINQRLARAPGALAFRRVIEQLESDFAHATSGLRHEETGTAMHALQTEIEETIKSLLAALDDAKSADSPPGETESPPRSPEEGEANQSSPLLPSVAELRLLRSAQQRINDRTAALSEAASAERGERNALFDDLGARQRALAELAHDIAERTR